MLSDQGSSSAVASHIETYLHYLTDVRGLSPNQVDYTRCTFRRYLTWLEASSIMHEDALTQATLEKYVLYIQTYRKRSGELVTANTQRKRLSVIFLFCRYLFKHNLFLTNPAKDLKLPKLGNRLPRVVFSAAEMVRILSVPDVTTPQGLRDRAIIEVFYSTGIRKSELLNLHLSDVDFDHGVIHVRSGKGSKDRVVAVGENTLLWLQRYLADVRKMWHTFSDIKNIFITANGRALSSEWLGCRILAVIKAAHLGRVAGCHAFRHTCGTLMLMGGASIRYVQAQLGHSQVETTALYTRVTIVTLKDMFRKYHPRFDAAESSSEEFIYLLAEYLKLYSKRVDIRAGLSKFFRFCLENGVYAVIDITHDFLTDFETHMNALGLARKTTRTIGQAVNGFLRFVQIPERKWHYAPVAKTKALAKGVAEKSVAAIKAPRKFDLSAEIQSQIEIYATHLRVQHYKATTIGPRIYHVKLFFEFMKTLNVMRSSDVTLHHLTCWQHHLSTYRKLDGAPLSAVLRIERARHAVDFFDFLFSRNLILVNPGDRMEFARQPRRLPMNILSSAELKRILNAPEIFAHSYYLRSIGYRNKAIVELLAATGIRRLELVNLKLSDINAASQTLFIRSGKGDKDRVVPVTPRALYWLTKYVTDYRPSSESFFVFLKPADRRSPKIGIPLRDADLDDIIKYILEKTGIEKHGRSHLFRHTLATELLEAGVDVRLVQELLGHKSLNTTDIYTHVSIAKLKEVHAATHPGESLTRQLKLANGER